MSQHGVRGNITFSQDSGPGSEVTIKAKFNLDSADRAGEYSWGVYEFPVDYSREDYCHARFECFFPFYIIADYTVCTVRNSQKVDQSF